MHVSRTDAVKLLADLCGDCEPRGDVDTTARHLTQVGALATEQLLHALISTRFALDERVNAVFG
jgi:hypothetical protein